jgi:trimeric autotransporter adhesin
MGKIELDHTGAGSGITLSSDGTDLLLNGTAVGGGGTALELYAENPSSPTAPSATGTNAVAIGNGSTATNTDAFAIGRLTDATGSGSVAIGYSVDATGLRSLAIGAGTDATSSYASAIGTNSGNTGSQAVTGAGAMALGGSYASGTDSFAAAIANNTSSYGATGANSVAIGAFAKATGADSVAIGDTAQATNVGAMAFGRDSIASGYTSLALGRLNVASGSSSLALGLQNDATIDRSHAIGYNAKAETRGKFAFAAGSWAFGKVANQGKAQHGLYVLLSDTTDATPDVMTGDNKAETGSANTTNQIILPNNSAYAFHGTIVARQDAASGTACAAWKIEGLIRREGSAGTTVLVNSATTVLDNTPAWGMALSADTTNGGLKIEVTGAAATNIRWVATIHTSEVTY